MKLSVTHWINCNTDELKKKWICKVFVLLSIVNVQTDFAEFPCDLCKMNKVNGLLPVILLFEKCGIYRKGNRQLQTAFSSNRFYMVRMIVPYAWNEHHPISDFSNFPIVDCCWARCSLCACQMQINDLTVRFYSIQWSTTNDQWNCQQMLNHANQCLFNDQCKLSTYRIQFFIILALLHLEKRERERT